MPPKVIIATSPYYTQEKITSEESYVHAYFERKTKQNNTIAENHHFLKHWIPREFCWIISICWTHKGISHCNAWESYSKPNSSIAAKSFYQPVQAREKKEKAWERELFESTANKRIYLSILVSNKNWSGHGHGLDQCLNQGFTVGCVVLSVQESSVKKAFLKHSAGKLSIFFGPQRGWNIFSMKYVPCNIKKKILPILQLKKWFCLTWSRFWMTRYVAVGRGVRHIMYCMVV